MTTSQATLLGVGGGGVPVGALVNMPESVAVDQFTDGTATYLRSGVLVPYVSPDHDPLVALGLKHNKWLAASNNANLGAPGNGQFLNSNQISSHSKLPNPDGKMFALGTWGKISPVGPGLWCFSGIRSGVGQTAPVMISEPPAVLYPLLSGTVSGGIEGRSAPAYSAELGCWIIMETRTNGAVATQPVANSAVLYSSTDGSTWVESNIFTSTIGLNPGANISIACAGSIVHAKGIATSGALLTSASFKLGADRRTVQGATDSGISANGLNQAGFYQVTADSVIAIWPTGASPYAVNLSHCRADGVVTGFTNFSTSGTSLVGSIVDRNDTAVLVVNPASAQAQVYQLTGGRLLTETSPNYYFGAIHGTGKLALQASVVWTGSYWVYSGYDGTSNFNATSPTGVTWTAPSAAGASFYLNYNLYAYVGRNQIIDNGTGVGRLYTISTGVVTANLRAVPQRSPLNEIPVEFNGATICAYFGGVISRWGSDGIEDFVFWALTGGADFGSNSYIKIVNGRAFVVNTANGTLVHSADGIAWTSVAITGIGTATAVVDVEFIGSNWVILTAGGTANFSYSSDLVSFTSSVLGSSMGAGIGFIRGSSYVVAVTANGVRRSTNGSTWTTPVSGSPATVLAAAASVFNNGTTSYLFTYVSGATYNQYASADGDTWTLTTPTCLVVGKVPYDFRLFNGMVYCRGGNTRDQVYGGTTVANLASVSTLSPYSQINFSIMFVRNNSLRFRITTVSGDLYAVQDVVVDAIGTSALVGYDRPVKASGQVGFLRIK